MTKMPFLLLLLWLANTSQIALAQEPAKSSNLVPSSSQQDKPQKQSLLPGSISLSNLSSNIDPDKTIYYSAKDVVSLALENNLDVELLKENISVTEHQLQSLYGFYDEVFTAKFNYVRENYPSASLLYTNVGNDPINSFNLLNTAYSTTVGLSRRYITGGVLKASFTNERADSNQRDIKLVEMYSSKGVISFRQPVLRNFRTNDNRTKMRTLAKKLDIADLNFRQKAIDLVAKTQTTYYELAFAIKNEEILRQSIQLAEAQLELSKSRVEAGKAASVEIASAKAELELRRHEQLEALLEISKIENSLKNLILGSSNSNLWQNRILPLDSIEIVNEPVEIDTVLNIAMTQRPELKSLDIEAELVDIEKKFYENQGKPQLDAIGSFSSQNFGGAKNPVFAVQFQIPKQVVGNYLDQIAGLYKIRSYQVGADFSFTKGNHEANGNLARLQTVAKQNDIHKKQVLQNIMSEVYNAVQAVKTSYERIDAMHVAAIAAETQLKAEQKRFDMGSSTNFLVLQYQNKLALARGKELRAKVDYLKARAELQRVTANNLP